jgi:hypothetical protein
MKIIVAGSRDFNDYLLVKYTILPFTSKLEDVEIVSGGAKGADRLGEILANDNKYKLKIFPADWDKYGKSAGYKRNKQMAEYADALVAFWDGESKGTKMMIELAKQMNLKVKVVKY